MRKHILSLAIACAVAVPLSANAGLLDAVSSATGTSSSSNSGGDAVAQQDQLVSAYVAANKDVLMAQYKMADALGAKDAAALAKAEADALGSGATKDNLSKADSVQSDVSKAIADRQREVGNNLDGAAKKKYSEGLASLGKGMVRYGAMKTQFGNFKSALASASPMMLPKLSAGSYIVSNFPTNSKNVYDTLGQAVSFAKSNGIPVPADATKAL